MVPEVVPASFPQSAVHQPSDHTFFVGIPAWSQHLADAKYTRDGDTLIAITAVDDPFAQGSPFATLAEDGSDEEEKDQSGDQGDGA
ncbi:hypothetical protein PHMEG_00035760 [Phytophthora megakarya]|uniref:Uncharacterized protein n=1 Tax=Phytophthora megakarya TaxID=4795 RepID=A0A225UMM4_9STRA|nr:hypothetical protein PHMEG_00035760 [Phytophthora megakarya]